MDDLRYKFIGDPSCLRDVLVGRLRFTPPMELNDPSELVPRFSVDEVRASLADLRSRGHTQEELAGLHRQAALMQRLAPELPALPAPKTAREADGIIGSPAYDNIDLLEAVFSMLLQTISSRVGVACLTRRWNSLPMWAHYARCGRGIVVGYRGLENSYSGDQSGWLGRLTEIDYRRDLGGISFYPDSYAKIFFSKFTDWQYEMETRIVCPLAECQKIGTQSAPIFYQTLAIGCIDSLIFGWRMTDGERANVVSFVDQAPGPRPKLFQTSIVRGEVSLSAIPND